MTRRLSEMINEWVEEAIDAHGQGEAILFDLTMMPSSEQTGGPAMLVTLWMPSTTIGTQIHAEFPYLNPGGATREAVSNAMSLALISMREARSQALAAQGPAQAPTNGAGTPEPKNLLKPPGAS